MTLKPNVHVHIRRLFNLALIAAIALAQSGCLGGTTEVIPVSGVYELKTINGQALPFTFSNGQVVTRQVLTIKIDGSFTDVTTRQDGTVINLGGGYTNYAGTITFIDGTGGFVYQGIVANSELVIQYGNFRYVLTKTGPAPPN